MGQWVTKGNSIWQNSCEHAYFLVVSEHNIIGKIMALKQPNKASNHKDVAGLDITARIMQSVAMQKEKTDARINDLHNRRIELEKKMVEKRKELNQVLKKSERQENKSAEKALRKIISDIEKEIREILKQIANEQEILIKLAFARIDQLTGRTVKLVEISNDLKSMVYMDPLTMLGNRRGIEAKLVEESKEVLRSNNPQFAILFLDLDGLKWGNDTFGHEFGDEMLVKVGDVLKKDESLRVRDFAGRLGGDEFVVIMPNTTYEGANIVAKRISDMLNPDKLSPAEARKEKQLKNICVSFGVAALDEPEYSSRKDMLLKMKSDIKNGKASHAAVSTRAALEKEVIDIGNDMLKSADIRMQKNKEERKAGRDA